MIVENRYWRFVFHSLRHPHFTASRLMADGKAAQDAIRALDGTDFGGRTIEVNEAQYRQGGGCPF